VSPFSAEYLGQEGFKTVLVLADTGRNLAGEGDQPLDGGNQAVEPAHRFLLQTQSARRPRRSPIDSIVQLEAIFTVSVKSY
jgi:hypothetical protein